MDEVLRLNTNFPALAAAFHRASAFKRREAARVAVEIVIARTSLQGDLISEALELLRRRADPPRGLREHLDALAARLDESYFDAADNGDAASLTLFSSARAIAAVAYALSGDDKVLHEAIYEATVAIEDPAELVQAVAHILQ